MFQNDDLDLIAEKVNPDNPNQVWYRGKWVDMVTSEQQIAVKGQAPVTLVLRQSPHGPIVNDALGSGVGKTPIAMWWAFLESQNPILEGFYQLNRADTLAKARSAASQGPGPGPEHRLGQRQGRHRLVGRGAAAETPGGCAAVVHPRRQHRRGGQGRFLPVQRQPAGREPGAGLHRLGQLPAGVADRHGDPWLLQPRRSRSATQSSAQRQNHQVGSGGQPEAATGHHHRLRPALAGAVAAGTARSGERSAELKLVEQLAQWKGDYPLDSTSATLFNQFLFNLADATMHDELGNDFFETLALDPGDRCRAASPGGERRIRRGGTTATPSARKPAPTLSRRRGGRALPTSRPPSAPISRNGNGARRTR